MSRSGNSQRLWRISSLLVSARYRSNAKWKSRAAHELERGLDVEALVDFENMASFSCRYASMAASLFAASSSEKDRKPELRFGMDEVHEAIVDACPDER